MGGGGTEIYSGSLVTRRKKKSTKGLPGVRDGQGRKISAPTNSAYRRDYHESKWSGKPGRITEGKLDLRLNQEGRHRGTLHEFGCQKEGTAAIKKKQNSHRIEKNATNKLKPSLLTQNQRRT